MTKGQKQALLDKLRVTRDMEEGFDSFAENMTEQVETGSKTAYGVGEEAFRQYRPDLDARAYTHNYIEKLGELVILYHLNIKY